MMNPEIFDGLMKQFTPFERRPHIAVGVSGGADSMALVLLIDGWARPLGGRVTALIVDHDLRPESADEAATVSRRLSGLGIDSRILCWQHDNSRSAIQERARAGRYQVMEQFCKDNGVLHLATAHHADDQTETMLMRLQRGSGTDGLAGIPATRELTWCRIIRPFLGVRKQTLIHYLRSRRVEWVEDSSNANPAYERSRVRHLISSEGINAEGYAVSAARYARLREAVDVAVSKWLALNAKLSRFGYLQLDYLRLFEAPEDIRLRVLSRAATVIGGKVHPPAIASIERLENNLQRGKPSTLSGVIFRQHDDQLIACREARNLPPLTHISARHLRWDGRFQIDTGEYTGKETDLLAGSLHVLPFCEVPDPDKNGIGGEAWFSELPHQARLSLPVFRIGDEFLLMEPGAWTKSRVSVRFEPKLPLTGMGFSVA